MAEAPPLNGTSIRALSVPAGIGKPNPQSDLVLVGARQPHKIALKCRRVNLHDKHGPDRDDDRSQRNALTERNDGKNATTTPGTNLRTGSPKGSVRQGGETA